MSRCWVSWDGSGSFACPAPGPPCVCVVNPTSPRPHLPGPLQAHPAVVIHPSLLCLCAHPKPRLRSVPLPSCLPCPSAFSSQVMPPALLEHSLMGKPFCKGAVGWENGFSNLPPAAFCCCGVSTSELWPTLFCSGF